MNDSASDAKKLAAQQQWAQPQHARIHLEGIAPPRGGRKGRLGFRIHADWMEGHLEMRFPETLRSSLGLHFIDHDRRDMPQLSPLPDLPRWEHDEETGEVHYVCQTSEGVEFRGRARPYEEEVYMEFSVANNTETVLRGVSPQMCLSMAPAADFNLKSDLANTCGWLDGRWMSLESTTPTP